MQIFVQSQRSANQLTTGYKVRNAAIPILVPIFKETTKAGGFCHSKAPHMKVCLLSNALFGFDCRKYVCVEEEGWVRS